jgi:predicted ester cyclase
MWSLDMATKTIKENIMRYFNDVVGKGDLVSIDDLVHPEARDMSGEWPNGREGFRRHISWFHSSFDISNITVERIITDGEYAVVYWNVKGRHIGHAFGVEPSGKEIENSAISTLGFLDGKIFEYQVMFDMMNFFVQVGNLGSWAKYFPN